MSENYVDESPEYWAGYSNLQHVKHELIRRYLGGWFPMLGTWAGRVLYLDTHAGRGTYLTGQSVVANRRMLGGRGCRLRSSFVGSRRR